MIRKRKARRQDLAKKVSWWWKNLERLVTPESGIWINMFASFHIWTRPRQMQKTKRIRKKMQNFERLNTAKLKREDFQVTIDN